MASCEIPLCHRLRCTSSLIELLYCLLDAASWLSITDINALYTRNARYLDEPSAPDRYWGYWGTPAACTSRPYKCTAHAESAMVGSATGVPGHDSQAVGPHVRLHVRKGIGGSGLSVADKVDLLALFTLLKRVLCHLFTRRQGHNASTLKAKHQYVKYLLSSYEKCVQTLKGSQVKGSLPK